MRMALDWLHASLALMLRSLPRMPWQDVGAMNAEAGHAVFLGDVAQRVVCSPDMEQLLAARPAPQLWDYAPAAAAATTQPKKQEEDQAGVKKEED